MREISIYEVMRHLSVLGEVKVEFNAPTQKFLVRSPSIDVKDRIFLRHPFDHKNNQDDAIRDFFYKLTEANEGFVVSGPEGKQEFIWNGLSFMRREKTKDEISQKQFDELKNENEVLKEELLEKKKEVERLWKHNEWLRSNLTAKEK